MTTTTVSIPLGLPIVDESRDNTQWDFGKSRYNPPAGGIYGSGEQTEADSSNYVEIWNSSTASGSDPGRDFFDVPISAWSPPSGATITDMRFEVTRRLIEGPPPGYGYVGMPQGAPRVAVTIRPATGNAATSFLFGAGERDFDWHSITSTITIVPQQATLDSIAAGEAFLLISAPTRNLTVIGGIEQDPLAGAHVTRSQILVTYETPDTPAPLRQAPNRIVQRGNDGLGFSGGRRIVQNRTRQSTNRAGRPIR